MEIFYQLLGIVSAVLLIWFLYRTIKNRPEQFSKENLTKSLSTMGILGLILIVFVGFLIMFVRSS